MTFIVEGDVRAFPANPAPSGRRADGLWRDTCFEAFFANGNGANGNGAYTEANVAPSGDWNLYRFDAYRAGMRECRSEPPHVTYAASEDAVRFTARWSRAAFADVVSVKPAVVLREGESYHYFAPAHPQGRPDFHAAEGFVGWQRDVDGGDARGG